MQRVTVRNREIQRVTDKYRELQRDTERYRELQWVTAPAVPGGEVKVG